MKVQVVLVTNNPNNFVDPKWLTAGAIFRVNGDKEKEVTLLERVKDTKPGIDGRTMELIISDKVVVGDHLMLTKSISLQVTKIVKETVEVKEFNALGWESPEGLVTSVGMTIWDTVIPWYNELLAPGWELRYAPSIDRARMTKGDYAWESKIDDFSDLVAITDQLK